MESFINTLLDSIVKTALPLIAVYITKIIKDIFNNQMDIKIKELELKQASQESINAINRLKIDEQEQQWLQNVIQQGLHLADEVAYKSWVDSSVKEKTGQEKFDIAKKYVVDAINNKIQDPEKINQMQNIIDSQIEALLPMFRQELDNQYEQLKTRYIVKNQGKVPDNSRDPRRSSEEWGEI